MASQRYFSRHMAVALFVAGLAPFCFGQEYVSRFDAFVGYTYLNSPKIDLPEHGVHFQAGFRPRTWYSIGFDYSTAEGELRLTPGLLPSALQQQLGGQLAQLVAAGVIPSNYALVVPAHSRTHTFAAGPQLAFRHWARVTPFIRPSLGAIRETATPQPADPVATRIVQQLTPSGKKIDWTGFYGIGGGIDINATRHLALRVQADFVRDHLFNDILRESRNTVRFSIGPAFNFGRNIR